MYIRAVGTAIAAVVCLVACSATGPSVSRERATSPSVTSSSEPSGSQPAEPKPESVKVLAVGDIACDPTSPVFDDPVFCKQDLVANRVGKLVSGGASVFLPLGDLQYEEGSYDAFQSVYDKFFGDFRSITYPVAGNHEWDTEGAGGYFEYFGSRAGTAQKPWRTFEPVAGWRVLLLDSNCEFVAGCGVDSPQGRWIAKTLAANDDSCVLATWHHPLRTSGEYFGDEDSAQRAAELWQTVDAGGADLVLNGHDHLYERFRKFSDVQQFTVGTGGKVPYEITGQALGSQQVIADRYGVLQLVLNSDATYEYAFYTVDGDVLDEGQGRCTNEPQR